MLLKIATTIYDKIPQTIQYIKNCYNFRRPIYAIKIIRKKGSDILRGRFFRGLAAGTLIGAAAGMLLMPNMDRRTKKRLVRAGKRITDLTGDLWSGIKELKS